MRKLRLRVWTIGFLAGLISVLLPALASDPNAGHAQGAPAASEMATVQGFGGSDRLVVQNDAGLTYNVQYIGVRGPLPSSAFHAQASAFHGPLVIGQRVFLEADGKDEARGYRLRHVYLEGDPVPLGAKVLAAGWVVTAPYQIEHRQRDFYLQVQEQTMAQQVNLRQPGIFGPVAAWRPAGYAESGYIAAHPELHRFLELLNTVPTGQSVISRLLRSVPTMLLDDMPEGLGGFAEPLGYHVEFNRKIMQSDPRVMAAVIAHEGTHAIDFVAEALDLASFACVEYEQRAFGIEAQVWAEFFGPDGKPDPKDLWERSQNDVLRFAQRNDLVNFVGRSAGYERQCAGDRTPG